LPASLSSPPPAPKRPQRPGSKLVRGDHEDRVGSRQARRSRADSVRPAFDPGQCVLPPVPLDPLSVGQARFRLPTCHTVAVDMRLLRLGIDIVANMHATMLSLPALRSYCIDGDTVAHRATLSCVEQHRTRGCGAGRPRLSQRLDRIRSGFSPHAGGAIMAA
jgi:hypothetical protein